jgi:hypothetical protein
MQVTARDAPGNLKIATIKRKGQWSILIDKGLFIMCDTPAHPRARGLTEQAVEYQAGTTG